MEESGFPGARAAAPLPGECSGGRAGGGTHCLAPPPRGCLARSSASVEIRLAPAVHARAPRLSFPVPRPAGSPTRSAPSIPCKRRPSRALAQALAPPPPPPGESRAAALGARQAPRSSPSPFPWASGRTGWGGGPRCDCKCVCPGTGSGCGGAGDEEEWGGLGGGCLSGGWQSSAPWRGEGGTSQRLAFEDGVGVDIGRKDPVGCLRGAKVLGGQLGVSSLETTEG